MCWPSCCTPSTGVRDVKRFASEAVGWLLLAAVPLMFLAFVLYHLFTPAR